MDKVVKFTWEWIQYAFNYNIFNNESDNKKDNFNEDLIRNNENFDLLRNNKNLDLESFMQNSEIIYW